MRELNSVLLGFAGKVFSPILHNDRSQNELKTLQDIQQEFTMDVPPGELEQYGVPLRCLGKSAYEQSPMHEALC